MYFERELREITSSEEPVHINPSDWSTVYAIFLCGHAIFTFVVGVRLVYLIVLYARLKRRASRMKLITSSDTDMWPKVFFFTSMTFSRLANTICFGILLSVMIDNVHNSTSILESSSINTMKIVIWQYLGNSVFVIMVVSYMILILKTLSVFHEQYKKSNARAHNSALDCCCRLPTSLTKITTVVFYIIPAVVAFTTLLCDLLYGLQFSDAEVNDDTYIHALRYVLALFYLICGISLLVTSMIITCLYREENQAWKCGHFKVLSLAVPTAILLILRSVKEFVYTSQGWTRYRHAGTDASYWFFVAFNIFFDLIPSILLTILMWPLPQIDKVADSGDMSMGLLRTNGAKFSDIPDGSYDESGSE